MIYKSCLIWLFLLPSGTAFLQDTLSAFNILDWVTPLIDTVIDVDGNLYHTQQIGDQVWMLENLKATRFRNGAKIPVVSNNKDWINTRKPALCKVIGKFDRCTDNIINTGHLLYNYYVIQDSAGICPCGWRVPSPEDFQVLETYCQKLNDAYQPLWLEGSEPPPPRDYFDAFRYNVGFTSILHGYRSVTDGDFYSYNYWGYWWTTDPEAVGAAWFRTLDRGYGIEGVYLEQTGNQPNNGHSIKCIRER